MSPMLTLAASQWLVGGLIVLGIFASVLMILTILIQRPQGGGLAAAFGGAGAGSGQTAFGAKTGDALTIATIVVFIFWLLVSIGLVHATKRPEASAQNQKAPAEQIPGEGPGEGTTPFVPGPIVPSTGDTEPAPSDAPSDEPAPVEPATMEPAPSEGAEPGAAGGTPEGE